MSTAASPHLLHRLYTLQQQHQHIPAASIAPLAEELGLPLSQVQAVIDFYSFFHREPCGEFHLLFSNCPCCGDLTLMQQLCELLNVTPDSTRADGRVSIGQTSCIGMCDQGAAVLLNGLPLVGLSAQQLPAIAMWINTGKPEKQAFNSVKNCIRHAGVLLNNAPEIAAVLQTAQRLGTAAVLETLTQAGLRGRGGAGFSTARKWQLCRTSAAPARYVVCNADEGEPGTFKDRVLLTAYAEQVLAGMMVCAQVIDAQQGFLYLRAEYRYLLPHLETTLARLRNQGYLDTGFDISIVVGAGAYVCGEESALLESLEGKRGIPRVRPPFPVTHGYRGQPTVVNNVETFVAASHIIQYGAAAWRSYGTAQSSGTKLFSVSGDCAAPGLYELPFGTPLQALLEQCGGQDAQAVQVSGASGTLVAPTEFGRKLAFEDLNCGGAVMVFGQQRDLLALVANFTRFFAHESCGFCTPCRVGTPLLCRYLDKLLAGQATTADLSTLQQLGTLLQQTSHCGLGQTAANPLRDLLAKFPQAYQARLQTLDYTPYFDLDAALAPARELTQRHDAEAHLT